MLSVRAAVVKPQRRFINFRTHVFDSPQLRSAINTTKYQIGNEWEIKVILQGIQAIQELTDSLVFSQYLNNIAYYICHMDFNNKKYKGELIEKLIKKYAADFFHSGFVNYPTPFYTDPQEGVNVLHSLSRNILDIKLIKSILEEAEKIWKNDLKSFKQFITHRCKDNFSPIHGACKVGNSEAVKLLLPLLRDTFTELDKNDEGFMTFLTSEVTGHSSLFHLLRSGIHSDLFNTVKRLLKNKERARIPSYSISFSKPHITRGVIKAREVKDECTHMISSDVGDEKAFRTDLAPAFLNEDSAGFTSLTSILEAKNVALFEKTILIVKEATLKVGGKEAWKKILGHENTRGVTLFNSAANGEKVEMLQLIWREAVEVFSDDAKGLKEFFIKPNRHNFTPLRSAIHRGRVNIVNELLEIAESIMGIETNEFLNLLVCKDSFGDTAIGSLCRMGWLNVFTIIMPLVKRITALLNKINVFEELLTSPNQLGFTPLNAAAAGGHVEIAELLFNEYKELISCFDRQAKHEKLVNFVESADVYNFTPLTSAIKIGCIPIVNMLLSNIDDSLPKAILEKPDVYGVSALHNACILGNFDMFHLVFSLYKKLFVETFHYELFERRDNHGHSVLNALFANGDNEVILFSLDYLERLGKENLAQLKTILARKDGFDFGIINTIIKRGDVGKVKIVLEFHQKIFLGEEKSMADPKAKKEFEGLIIHPNNKGFTPFNSACASNNIELVKMLLDSWSFAFQESNREGFSKMITQENASGFTPLISACYNKNFEMVKLLLETAAKVYGEQDTPEFKRFIDFKYQNKHCALSTAIRERSEPIKNLLLKYGAATKYPHNKPQAHSSTFRTIRIIGDITAMAPKNEAQVPVPVQQNDSINTRYQAVSGMTAGSVTAPLVQQTQSQQQYHQHHHHVSQQPFLPLQQPARQPLLQLIHPANYLLQQPYTQFNQQIILPLQSHSEPASQQRFFASQQPHSQPNQQRVSTPQQPHSQPNQQMVFMRQQSSSQPVPYVAYNMGSAQSVPQILAPQHAQHYSNVDDQPDAAPANHVPSQPVFDFRFG